MELFLSKRAVLQPALVGMGLPGEMLDIKTQGHSQ